MRQKKMLVITYSVNEYEPDKLLKIISAINSKSDDEIFNAYSARVKFRGFSNDINSEGYIKIQNI